MSKELTFTIRDTTGQDIIINNLNIASGTIVTDEMRYGTNEDGRVGDNTEDSSVDLDTLDINNAPGMAISATVTAAVSQYLEATVQSLIAEGSGTILGKLGVNEENLELAQSLLNVMNNSITMIETIIPFIPKNIMMTPSPKVALSSISTSLKDMFNAVYINAEQYYYEHINDAITNLPNTQEILKDAQEALLSAAESLIDEQCVKYTGKTYVELYNMCHPYLAKYKEYREARKQRKSQQNNNEDETSDSTLSGSNIDGTSSREGLVINSDAIKQTLLEELYNTSDLIYNAFMIIQIKDAIQSIRDLIKQFNNINLTVMTDGIDSLDDLMNMLSELGLDDDGAVITLADAVKNGINQLTNNLNGLTTAISEQALSSAVNIIGTTQNSVNISKDKTFEFKTNTENQTLTLTIYKDPTTKTIRKNLSNTLSKASDTQGNSIFSANDVITILNTIIDGYAYGKDQTITFINFDLIIHYQLNNANISSLQYDTTGETTPENATKYVDSLLSQLETNKAELQESSVSTYELGVVTEEYTKDPETAAKRPTFALIHELFSVLKEVFPLLKTFCTLINNYKINKAKVESQAEGNIFGMIKVLAKINNLLKSTNRSNKNFYTVRSLKLYEYVTQNIKQPNEDSTEIDLDGLETRKFYLYLKAQNLNYNSINQKLETILYIDNDSINDQRNQLKKDMDKASQYFGNDTSLFVQYPDSKYEDGTLLGLDKVQEAGDMIYYSDSSLPLYGSQILRCYSQGYDVSI